MRYTYSDGIGFYGPDDVSLISDSYVSDDFYYPELKVRKLVFSADGMEDGIYRVHPVLDRPESSRLIVYLNDGTDVKMENGDRLTCYLAGDAEKADIRWVYRDLSDKDRYLEPESCVEMSLLDLVENAEWDEDGISTVDKYNAAVAAFNDLVSGGIIDCGFPEDTLRLNTWFEYSITLGPGEKTVNRVESVLAPEMTRRREPFEYSYEYLLSPAECWKSFGSLDININTPYELKKSSEPGFAVTETGYGLKLDALPETELTFILRDKRTDNKNAGATDPSSGSEGKGKSLFAKIIDVVSGWFM